MFQFDILWLIKKQLPLNMTFFQTAYLLYVILRL